MSVDLLVEKMLQLQQLLETPPCEILQGGRLRLAMQYVQNVDRSNGVECSGNSLTAYVYKLLDEAAELQKKLTEIRVEAQAEQVSSVSVDDEYKIVFSPDKREETVVRSLEEIKRKIRRTIGYTANNRINFVWPGGAIY